MKQRIFLKIWILIVSLVTNFRNADSISGQFAPEDFRLPTTVLPLDYHLSLFVVLDPLEGYQRFTSTGNVTINVTCTETTNKIYLHAVNLTIFDDSVRVLSETSGLDLPVTNIAYEELNDFLIISLGEALQGGQNYRIQIKFIAPIPDYRLNGMYQDFYTDPETAEKKYLATTLFAPYHARRLFPCFDEPSFRARYDVEIAHHKKYHAIANGEIIRSHPLEGLSDYVQDVFRTTPSISSYITAMIVSDFTYEEAPIAFGNRSIRTYASPHLINKGAATYSVNISNAVLSFYENRFEVKYPLIKLYSVALPNFFFSAMENIGLITYKEPVLLYFKNETTEEERYQINYVIGHEIGHQWYGNIVACKWWAYVWLKEGFATFYSHYAMNYTNPEMKPWEMFVPKILAVAMKFDAGNATHPLENFPPTSEEVANIYTTIPYQKGASVIRMASTFLTENVFEDAMKLYINRYQYKSAEQNDLFDAFQDSVDENPLILKFIPAPIRQIMNSWCQQSRFPLVTVSRINETSIKLTQREFSDDGSSDPSKTWWVPINLEPSSRPDLPGTVPDTWIPQHITSIEMEVTSGEAVIVNPEATGYYIVEYDETLLKNILEVLERDHLKLSASTRSKLLHDYFQLALSGHVPLDRAMDLTNYIHSEMNYSVWKTFQDVIKNLLEILKRKGEEETVELMKDYLLLKLTNVWKQLHQIPYQDGELIGMDKMLQELLIKWSCELGSCLDLSSETVVRFLENPGSIEVSKEKQHVLYCSALSQEENSQNVFQFIIKEYMNPDTLFGRKNRLLMSLTCTKSLDTLKWLIDEIFKKDSEYFGLDASFQLLNALGERSLPANLLLDKILQNPTELISRFQKNLDDVLFNVCVNVKDRNEEVSTLMERLGSINEVLATNVINRLEQSNRQRISLDSTNLYTWLLEN